MEFSCASPREIVSYPPVSRKVWVGRAPTHRSLEQHNCANQSIHVSAVSKITAFMQVLWAPIHHILYTTEKGRSAIFHRCCIFQHLVDVARKETGQGSSLTRKIYIGRTERYLASSLPFSFNSRYAMIQAVDTIHNAVQMKHLCQWKELPFPRQTNQ